MEWFLETLGTELISAIIGCFIGSGVTYRIMYKKYVEVMVIKQKQKADDKAKQTQIGVINENK